MVQGFGLGDPDALITGDVRLPRIVCAALGDHERASGLAPEPYMLQLLAPYAGQRFRVCRLLIGAR
jgi:hypothetical protein